MIGITMTVLVYTYHVVNTVWTGGGSVPYDVTIIIKCSRIRRLQGTMRVHTAQSSTDDSL